MTVVATNPSGTLTTPGSVPPLENGDRLTAGEFLRRYDQMPHVNKAQLIEGIVYMPSPVSCTYHGQPHSTMNFWLGYYVSKTPGLILTDNTTTELDEDNVPQPDLLIALPETAGGKTRITDNDLLAGPPELAVEIASTSASIDLNTKLQVYRRNGVAEYLVWRTRDSAVDWFVLGNGTYHRLEANPDTHHLESRIFPGLHLDPTALLTHDMTSLTAAVERGCKTQAHAEFAQTLRS